MNLSDMRTAVRRDLHDEDEENYRWTDDVLDRHINHAVKDYSLSLPREQKTTLVTTAGSREIDVSTLDDRLIVEAIEYPAGKTPPRYQRFALWDDTATLLGDDIPDGSGAAIYFGVLHTIDESDSTIPAAHEDIIVSGACGYAAQELSVHAVNRVSIGGISTPDEFRKYAKDRLDCFRRELRKLGRKNRIRARSLYLPHFPPVSRSRDFGP